MVSSFIEFETLEQAENAIKSMNGFSLGGRQLKVNHSTASQSSQSQQPAAAATGANMVPVAPMGPSFNHSEIPPPPSRGLCASSNACTTVTRRLSRFLLWASAGGGLIPPPPGLVGFAPGIPAGGLKTPPGLPALPLPGMPPLPGLPPLPLLPGMPPPPPIMGMGALGVAPTVESLSREENVTISGSERLAVMQKLAARSGTAVCSIVLLAIDVQHLVRVSLHCSFSQPSRVIALRNMVTPEEVDERLENEVRLPN